mgnify:CR=1 FL=1
MLKVLDTTDWKYARSEEYNFDFNKKDGLFVRWGKTLDDDPEYSVFGNEILDIEVSTICHRACSWCYKSNGVYKGKNMSFETFKVILDKMPPTLTQIAFGIGDIDANPDLWRMMRYCRENGIVPNLTINGERMTNELYDNIAKYCGAVAVSLYNKNTCYNAVAELSKRMKQVNIHCLLAAETYELCSSVISDIETDPRLKDLNAIIYLWLKPKGRRNTFHQITESKYRDLVSMLIDKSVRFGFDSCSAPSFLKVTENNPNFERFKIMAESCESTLFSYYINVDGVGFPCSFSENTPDYKGIDVIECEDFVRDVWYGEETEKFRSRVINNKDRNECRMCPIYNLGCK